MRPTDDELTALLAEHQKVTKAEYDYLIDVCCLEGEEWPCAEVRLATEVRDLRAVVSWFKDNREASYNDLEQAALCGEGPLARYEEGGR